MAIKQGGAAFPRPAGGTGPCIDPQYNHAQSGMSLRDYFAAKAMAGCLANPDIGETIAKVIESGNQSDGMGVIGKVAYATADAMLAAREAHP